MMVVLEGVRKLIEYIRFGSSYNPTLHTYFRYSFNGSASRLLNLLPGELRNQIWNDVLDLPTMVIVQFDRPVRMNRAFFRVCQQIYIEIDYLLYSRHVFCLQDPRDLVRFIDGLNFVQRRNIKRLVICDDS